jgi:hypothetical protein
MYIGRRLLTGVVVCIHTYTHIHTPYVVCTYIHTYIYFYIGVCDQAYKGARGWGWVPL